MRFRASHPEDSSPGLDASCCTEPPQILFGRESYTGDHEYLTGKRARMNGVHIPVPERFPSLRHFTERPSEPTVERVSKVTPATDQIEGDRHGTEAKDRKSVV